LEPRGDAGGRDGRDLDGIASAGLGDSPGRASAEPWWAPAGQRRPRRLAVVRRRAHHPTTDHVRRRAAEGRGKRGATRRPARLVAREAFGRLCRVPHAVRPEQTTA
jgi:hypothetical protein